MLDVITDAAEVVDQLARLPSSSPCGTSSSMRRRRRVSRRDLSSLFAGSLGQTRGQKEALGALAIIGTLQSR